MTPGLEDAAVFFALVLALAMLVERLLEVLKAAYDLLDSRFDWHRYWTARADALRGKLERKLRTLRLVKRQYAVALLARLDDRFVDGPLAEGRVPVIAGDLVRAAAVKVAARALGVAAGVGLAIQLKLNLVTYWVAAGGPAPSPEWVQVGITGAAIGLGSGPVHKLIRSIESRQARRTEGGPR